MFHFALWQTIKYVAGKRNTVFMLLTNVYEKIMEYFKSNREAQQNWNQIKKLHHNIYQL